MIKDDIIKNNIVLISLSIMKIVVIIMIILIISATTVMVKITVETSSTQSVHISAKAIV